MWCTEGAMLQPYVAGGDVTLRGTYAQGLILGARAQLWYKRGAGLVELNTPGKKEGLPSF